jgi:hypothetical protein
MRRRTCHRCSVLQKKSLVAVVVLAAETIAGCTRTSSTPKNQDVNNVVTLMFQLELNPRVYEDSLWADPPQLAIWMENEADRSIRTVCVTLRTASGYWSGKVECSVALPYWVSFYNRETGTQGPPTWNHPIADAVTCATPRAELTANAKVACGTKWTYYVEVNVSGDFNPAFPRMSDSSGSDRYGNGQPSLVYRGHIDAMDGSTSHPQLVGRTDQYEPVAQVIEDMDGLTTAVELLKQVTVSCKKETP